MANLRDIKKRILNVAIVEKITQSMKAISSSRLSGAKAQRYGNSHYFITAYDVVNILFNLHKDSRHSDLGGLRNILFTEDTKVEEDSIAENSKVEDIVERGVEINPLGKTLLIYIAADRGLCGSYNSNLTKAVSKKISQLGLDNVVLCPIGAKASSFSNKTAKETALDLHISSDLKKISNDSINMLVYHICALIKKQEITGVEIIYTHSESVLAQVIKSEILLPINIKKFENEKEKEVLGKENLDNKHNFVTDNFLFESTLDEVLKNYFLAVLYDKLTDSMVAEYASRLNAMNNAHDNCKELKQLLELEYNRTRQGIVTRELIEIISGAESI